MTDDVRGRILLEVQLLHWNIAECAHCRSLIEQIARLTQLLPPEPIEANGYRYVFSPPPEYEALVERRLAEIAPHLMDLPIPPNTKK